VVVVVGEDVRAGGDGGHGPDSPVEFPSAAERRDRRRAQQETRQQGEDRHLSLSQASHKCFQCSGELLLKANGLQYCIHCILRSLSIIEKVTDSGK